MNLMKSNTFRLIANEALWRYAYTTVAEAHCVHSRAIRLQSRILLMLISIRRSVLTTSYYMNKGKLKGKIPKTTISGITLNVLKLPAEVALSIFHSIYPKRLYTLVLHFHILHIIKNISSVDMNEFLEISFEHKLSNSANLALCLTQIIQDTCFDQSPLELTRLREGLGKNQTQIKLNKLPFLYSVQNILDVFCGKKSDIVFTISIIEQSMSMLNPKYSLSAINVHKERSKRDTY
jgi:hypothetical protein